MWLSNSKKYAMNGFLDERARSGIVHEVVGYGYRSRATRRKSKNLAHPITGPFNNRPIQ
jgi:hypothetical protein